MSTHKLEYVEGSGNIYEDLGFPDAEERLAKAKLAMRIENIIEKRKLKQIKAAEILGINQPKVSALMNGRLSGFSIERLIHYLNLLDQDVEIVVKTKRSRLTTHGRLKVAFG
jgi:predicted XRE-type DNA-binding protein